MNRIPQRQEVEMDFGFLIGSELSMIRNVLTSRNCFFFIGLGNSNEFNLGRNSRSLILTNM